MKHTLKAKYAANGLTAHRQRQIAQVPEAVKRMQDQARLDEITARLKAKPGDFAEPDLRSMSKASLVNFFGARFEKSLSASLAQLKATKFGYVQRPAQYKGKSADVVIHDDLRHDDMIDAVAFSAAQLAPFWKMGVDIARPGSDSTGVIQVNATC